MRAVFLCRHRRRINLLLPPLGALLLDARLCGRSQDVPCQSQDRFCPAHRTDLVDDPYDLHTRLLVLECLHDDCILIHFIHLPCACLVSTGRRSPADARSCGRFGLLCGFNPRKFARFLDDLQNA